jgi:hypothetical protein
MAFSPIQMVVLKVLKKALGFIQAGAMRKDFPADPPFDIFKSKAIQECRISDGEPGTPNMYDHDNHRRVFSFDGMLLDSIHLCWSKPVSLQRYLYEWNDERRLDWCVTFLAHEFHHIPQKADSDFHRELWSDGFTFDKVDYKADAMAIEVNYRVLPGAKPPHERVADIIAVICHSARIFSGLEDSSKQETHITGSRLRRNLCWLFQYSRYRAMVDARGITEMDIHSEIHVEAILVGEKGKNLCMEDYVNRTDFKKPFNLQITYDSPSQTRRIPFTKVEIASVGSPAVFGFLENAVFDFNLNQAYEVFRPVFTRNPFFLLPFFGPGSAVRDEMVRTVNFFSLEPNARGGRPYTDDALEISPYDIPADSLAVKILYGFDPHGDVFDGRTNPIPSRSLVDGWFRSYHPLAREYFEEQLGEHQSRTTHDCKIGFVSFDSSLNGKDVSEPLLEIRPLNHLVTELFNRSLGKKRVTANTDPQSNRIWEGGITGLFARPQDYRMILPSQLFIEFALVTSDGQVPISTKMATNAIYAFRNNGKPVLTCGLEYGPNWVDCVDSNAFKGRINLMAASLKALKTEYSIEYMDSGTEGTPAPDHLYSPKKPVFRFTSLVLQGVHLNAALLGYCILPFSRAVLEKHLKKAGTLKGLDFRKMEWLSLSDCEARVEQDQAGSSWHGTALKRLQCLADNRYRIEELLPAMW